MAAYAARQHGVISIAQLHAAGLSASGVSRRVRAGYLHRIHRGVYAVGHTGLNPQGRWMAAALACGDEAVLSHRSAAALWGLLAGRDGPIDISVPGTSGKRAQVGIRLHRSRTLTAAQSTRRAGIPVTTPTRTIEDLQHTASPAELRRAKRQASVLRLRIEDELLVDRTRSDLELAFLRLCKCHVLPAPEVNVRVDSFEVDFLWRDRRLIVETDGYRYHRGRTAFEDDRDRDLKLRALDFDVVRLSYRQVTTQAKQIASLLHQKLS